MPGRKPRGVIYTKKNRRRGIPIPPLNSRNMVPLKGSLVYFWQRLNNRNL